MPTFPHFWWKTNYFWTKSALFFWESIWTQITNFSLVYFILQKCWTKTISKKVCAPGCQSYFCQTGFHHYWLKIAIFRLNRQYFSGKAWELKMTILHFFTLSFYYTEQKTISKNFAPLAARAIFVNPVFTIFD